MHLIKTHIVFEVSSEPERTIQCEISHPITMSRSGVMSAGEASSWTTEEWRSYIKKEYESATGQKDITFIHFDIRQEFSEVM